MKTTLTAVPGEVQSHEYIEACAQNMTKSNEFSGCGDKKACFLYPYHCKENDCVAAVSFEYLADSNIYQVEMYADPGPTPGYVGVAFSEDADMANDETFVCAAITDEMSVQHGLNPGKFNERVITNDLMAAEVKLEDGRLACRFKMSVSSTVGRIKLVNGKPEKNDMPFDKGTAWRIQLAWGPVMPDSNVITRHKDMPATTFSSIRISESDTHRGTAFHILVRVHGALMIVAWTFLSGIVTVIARHYKDMMAKKRLFGTKIWFQAADPHAYWGLAVAVAVGLQIIAGMLRPGPDHKLRIFFNWGHRILGQASHVIAAVTMFLAFKIDYITEDMHDFGMITLSIWAGVQIMWHICFEIVSCIIKRSEPDGYQLDDSKETKGSWIPAVLMTIYVMFLAACCTSVLCAFLFY
ncbi:ferric-chelate reductase [Elysia marginata]|uniref:Ferric-chelate reductase n=1 Tax=Elysia marginata TaxID=1093978 RepID=A0AAV4JGH7_9GAST|nr:ferric-chelate reductase [Elysia marginata]